MENQVQLLIGNIFDYSKLKLPIKICNEYTLRKATLEESKGIKKCVDSYSNILGETFYNRFEVKAKKNNETNRYYITPIDINEWNYFLIEGNTENYQNVISALQLSKLDITIIFMNLNLNNNSDSPLKGYSHMGLSTLIFLDEKSININEIESKKVISNFDIKEINEIFKSISNIDWSKNEIKKALDDFHEINNISNKSSFKTVSYFSILELLLTTYKPKGGNESTLNAQLQNKINLINNLSHDNIDIREYFQGPDTLTLQKIIEKLYQYRNSVAHGNFADFNNEFQILNGKESIHIFLRRITKMILLEAIKKPQFLNDLKKC